MIHNFHEGSTRIKGPTGNTNISPLFSISRVAYSCHKKKHRIESNDVNDVALIQSQRHFFLLLSPYRRIQGPRIAGTVGT